MGFIWQQLESIRVVAYLKDPRVLFEGSMPVNEADDFFLLNGGRA